VRRYPLDFIELESVWVRGDLGPLTVWVLSGGFRANMHLIHARSAWQCVYTQTHPSSFQRLVELKFPRALLVRPGSTVGLYVHSCAHGDQAIVYDNQRSLLTHEDDFVKGERRLCCWQLLARSRPHSCLVILPASTPSHVPVHPGLAHLVSDPFSAVHPWGAWRRNREFVGRISYGVRYLLWNPTVVVHDQFNTSFKQAVLTMLLCQRRRGCPVSWIGDDCLFLILNMYARWRGRGRGGGEGEVQEKDRREQEERGGGGAGSG
jgi:hypothetical protein